MRDGDGANPDPQDVAERAARLFLERDRGTPMLGCALVSIGPGRAVVRLVIEPRHLNSADVCHGGIVFALAGSPISAAIPSPCFAA